MITRQQIKKAIPRGKCKEIAKSAGVTNKAVSDYLGGKNNSKRVEKAVLEVLESVKKEKEQFASRFLELTQ